MKNVEADKTARDEERCMNWQSSFAILAAIVVCWSAYSYARTPGFAVSSQVVEERGPSPHIGAASAFDAKRGRMIIFGGAAPGSADASDRLTTFDPASRQFSIIETEGARPSGVFHPSLVYEGRRDALFLFGGWPDKAEKPSDELWTLALSATQPTWTRLAPDGDAPRARNGAVMRLDAAEDRLLLHGGDGGPHPKFGFTPLNDLWAFDLTKQRWTRLRPTGARPDWRWNHCATIDEKSRQLFVFGGSGYTDTGSMVIDRDLFVLDLDGLAWTRRSCTGKCPGPVQDATLTFDAGARALVLAGGLSLADRGESGTRSLWLYDLAAETWSEKSGVDAGFRRAHTAVYDPRSKQHIIYGGQTVTARANHFQRGEPLLDALLITITRDK